jgi:hypothetical protein
MVGRGDVGDQAEGDDHDPRSASAGADGVGYFQRNRHRRKTGRKYIERGLEARLIDLKRVASIQPHILPP